jgi:hypothetical protein
MNNADSDPGSGGRAEAKKALKLAIMVAVLAATVPALGGGGGGGGGGRGGRGGMGGFGSDPMAQGGPGGRGSMGGTMGNSGNSGGNMETSSVAGLQAKLRATKEEWKVIGPILERLVADVQILNAASSGNLSTAGGFGATGGGRGGGWGGGNDTFSGPGSTATGNGRGGRGGRGSGPPDVAPMQGSQAVDETPEAPTTNPAPAATTPAARPDAPTSTALAAANLDEAGVGTPSKTITLVQALTDLQSALADSKKTEAQLNEKMAAVRDAREKTKLDLEAARKELLLLLTTDQEATLVAMGVLP